MRCGPFGRGRAARALRALDAELAASGVSLGVRIGIETGEVVAGPGTRGPRLVTGDTVNVAARLEQAAGPGEVLLGAGTHALVRDLAVVEPPEPLASRARPTRLPPSDCSRFPLRGPSGPGRQRRPIVGREQALAGPPSGL